MCNGLADINIPLGQVKIPYGGSNCDMREGSPAINSSCQELELLLKEDNEEMEELPVICPNLPETDNLTTTIAEEVSNAESDLIVFKKKMEAALEEMSLSGGTERCNCNGVPVGSELNLEPIIDEIELVSSGSTEMSLGALGGAQEIWSTIDKLYNHFEVESVHDK